jgi:hypothetical protein
MKKYYTFLLLGSVMYALLPEICMAQKTGTKNHQVREKTTFQTSGAWRPITDVRSDVAIVYGAFDQKDMTFEQRVDSWRKRGYITHFMTGIAWGGYQNYFTGKWDGKPHLDEGQVTQRGDTIWHGYMTPYIVPSKNYIKYMKEMHIKRVIDAGIDAIYLEEPEFWARAGYSAAFKKEWKEYYGFDWRPQHESAENTYLSNKLKYYLYYRALNNCFTFAKAYGKTKGMNVRCYVPTHSLLNYSQWQIVSPEASLASLPCVDGYIAQTWTGTSREPNYFNGIKKERVFENAFLEYGCMESMTAPTKRKVFFLTDPIEDWPRDWSDYKKNYQATFMAELLYPNNNNYEVMPWPDRIYDGLYKTNPHSDAKERIPRFYSTQMQVMVNSLNEMPLSSNKVSGSTGISVLMANSLMFQRTPMPIANYSDPQLSDFYGLALPLLKRGVPVHIIHLENVAYPETWKGTKVLLMSYSNMKPLDARCHQYIANWVKQGGILVYSASDKDPFQSVQEWWNKNGNKYRAPSEHLFHLLNLPIDAEAGLYHYGKGVVCVMRQDPKEYILAQHGDADFISSIKNLYDRYAKMGTLTFKNSFYLERGPYDLISVVDESPNHSESFEKDGLFIDLFDPELPILTKKTVGLGEQSFLYDIHRAPASKGAQVLAAASRVYEEQRTGNSYTFVTKSPLNTTNVMRILLPAAPKKIVVTDSEGKDVSLIKQEWDVKSKTCLLSFGNNPDGIKVAIRW